MMFPMNQTVMACLIHRVKCLQPALDGDVANYVTRFRVPSEQMVDAPVRLRSNHHVGMSRSLEQQRTMNDDDMSKNLPFERTTCRTTTELGRCCDSRSCDCTTGVMTNRCSYGHTRKINRSRLSHCGVG